MNLDRGERSSWPSELTYLLDRHPRSTWPAAPAHSVAFWLEVHAHLRRDAAGLDTAADDYRTTRMAALELAVIAAPRLRGLVANLHGHHQIEDFHYFPAFRRLEPRLAQGFDRLEADHAELAGDVRTALATLAELNNAAVRAAEAPAAAALRAAAERYIAASGRLCRNLERHLDDEEALVMPVLIEHESR